MIAFYCLFLLLKPSCNSYPGGGLPLVDTHILSWLLPIVPLHHFTVSPHTLQDDQKCHPKTVLTYIFQATGVYKDMNILFMNLNRGSVHKPVKIKMLLEPTTERKGVCLIQFLLM